MSDAMISDLNRALEKQQRSPNTGDEASRVIEELFRNYAALVYHSIRFRGVPAHAIDDVMLDVFTAAYKQLLKSESSTRHLVAKPRVWLYQLTSRLLADYFRTQAQAEKEVPLTVEVQEIPSSTDVADEVERRETTEIVQMAISTLPEYQRDIVLLDLQGFSTLEIAEILAIPTSTVKMLRVRAYKKLSTILSKEGLLPSDNG